MKNKKIIFLRHTLDKAGSERITSELSLNLPRNLERTIVLFENKVSFPYKGKLISLDIPFSKKFFPKLFNFFIGFLRFKKIVKEEKPDWVLSFGNEPNIINFLTKKNSLVRVDNFFPKSNTGFFGKLSNFLVKILFNRVKKVIVVSRGIENDLIKNFGIKKEKIKVIYNPIDVEKIQRLSNEPLEPKYQEIFKNSVIITVGRLGEQKSQWYLIRAFKEAKKRKKDLKLVILGEGELESYFRNLIKNLNLENDVYLLGWQKNPFKFLSKSKLFVLSSLWEGLPTVLLEATACGIPILSSDCKTGPREILAPETDVNYCTNKIEYASYGVLVPVCNNKFYGANDPITTEEKLLSKAIIEILTKEKLYNRLTEKSRERAEDFDVKNIIKNWDFLWK